MKKEISVSIIIVNYNTKKLTLNCLDSILRSKPKTSFEIIIIDNGSDEKLKINNKKVTLIRNKINLGFAKANNQGIRLAKGKCILLLNSDTLVKSGSIDDLYNFAMNNEAVGVVSPRLLNSDGSVQGSVFRLPTIGLAFREYFLNQKRLTQKYAPVGKLAVEVEASVMAAFLITPLALGKVGNLNEKYFMYFEDLDYCQRIRKAGLKIYYLPSAEVTHLHGASGATNKFLIESAKKYYGFWKYYLYTFILWLGQKWQKLMEKLY